MIRRLLKVLTKFSPVTAIYVEGLVAFVDLPNGRVEHKTVGAKLGGGNTIYTLVELVALSFVFILTIFVRTFELCTYYKID